jgi:3-hydroxyisobutyrate dehydrogenase-like beta-hydroxyacid dehydrogenase
MTSQILEFNSMTTIGFFGAGRMGASLVRTLAKSGHEVHVWNRTAAKAEALAPFGVQAKPTPEAAAAEAEIVFVNLLDYAASDAQLRKPEVTQTLKGKLLVQLTSGSPKASRDTGVWATGHCLNPVLADAYASLFRTAIQNGHVGADFAILARFMSAP